MNRIVNPSIRIFHEIITYNLTCTFRKMLFSFISKANQCKLSGKLRGMNEEKKNNSRRIFRMKTFFVCCAF